MAFAAGLAAAVGAAGCFFQKGEDVESSPDHVTAGGSTAAVLKSTLSLEGGCTATKVGPRHLLVSARCARRDAAIAAGSVIHFTSAASGSTPFAAAADAGAPSDDAGAGETDAGEGDPDPTTSTARSITIAEVHVHPSFEAKCAESTSCGLGSLDASDAPDVALLVLSDDLATVPSLPIDLDPVAEGDPLLAVSAGCTRFDEKVTGALETTRTVAVPARSAKHVNSPYADAPELVSRLAASYVVTAGPAWQPKKAHLCKSDIGAPLFRAGAAAVVGLASNFTTWKDGNLIPVTIEHTRVDAQSRFKVAAWLSKLGAETIHSCSEAAGGCVESGYDGGLPTPPGPTGDVKTGDDTGPTDGGRADATAPDAGSGDDGAGSSLPPTAQPEELPSDSADDTGDYGEADYGDAAVPAKKKKAQAGCSAAPGEVPAGDLAFGVALAFAVGVARRRKRA